MNRLNDFSFNYTLMDTDLHAIQEFEKAEKETWEIGNNVISTPHGNLNIESYIMVDQGNLVGIQLEVNGMFRFDNFSTSEGFEEEKSIGYVAILRQPQNAWLWIYMFNKEGVPIANFDGSDGLDGLADYITRIECSR